MEMSELRKTYRCKLRDNSMSMQQPYQLLSTEHLLEEVHQAFIVGGQEQLA